MSNSDKQDSIGDGSSNSEGSDDAAATFTGDDDRSVGITERLTEILVEEGDGDLMLSQRERGVWVLQWIHALDTQVMGACRVDERLKPLLKLSVFSGAAEDRLLAHLSQHFEASEVGILARCLCIPLVSIRVGKNIRQGNLLCPTAIRGSLNLMLLPTSDLRMSFIGDDGHTERLVTLSSSFQCSAAVIEEIPADNSGRSFLVKIPDHEVLYFWCSEKSMVLGIELLAKMKDLLTRKPSLSELTGICESRLDCFAAHLRTNLVGSIVSKTQTSSTGSSTSSSSFSVLDFCEVSQNAQCMFPCTKPMRFRQNQSMKSNSFYQANLSPRPSSFKEVFPRTLSSLKSAVREKLKRRLDTTPLEDAIASSITKEESTSAHFGKDIGPEISELCDLPPSTFLESLGKSAALASLIPNSSFLSPYYCWCPMPPPHVPFSSNESLSLPPLSTFLQSARSTTLLTSSSPLNIGNVTSLGLPAFFPDPLVRLPFSIPSSTQIPTFTPRVCDPIVHIPVINVCSSGGQGYLVSAGPVMSTSVQPIHPSLVNPLMPSTDSLVENGARETLRLLINSTNQSNPQLMDVHLPDFLTNRDGNQIMVQAGSRGVYVGSSDADAIANSFSAFRLVSSHSMGFTEESVAMGCSDKDDVDLMTVSSSGLDEFCSDAVCDSSKSMDKSID